MPRTNAVYKLTQSKTVLNKYVGGFWCAGEQPMDFLTGQRVIMDYEVYFNQKLCFWLKFQKKFLIFSLHKILCDGLGHVDYL